MKVTLTQEILKEVFDYREDGYLVWKIKTGNKVNVGTVAGYRCPKNQNREMIQVYKNLWVSARLIFMRHHGYAPEIVDHVDRNPANNKIENLRAATRYENSRNITSHQDSTSKYLGVNYDKSRGKWLARIRIEGKSKNLGRFDHENDAALQYNKYAIVHYKEFANLNVV